MITIEKFERIDENKTLKAQHINATMFWAYMDSKEAENELLNFEDVIWNEDATESLTACREYGIEQFSISSSYSSLMELLAEFEKAGCKMDGLVTVRVRYTDRKTGEKAMIPAITLKFI